MALVVETGDGLNASANSFADLTAIKAYLTDRGIAAPADATLIIQAILAMDWIASKEDRLQGARVSEAQPLCYPRCGVVLYGFDVGETTLPKTATLLQCQLVADQVSGIEIMPNMTEPTIKREKIGPTETEYAVQNGATNEPILAAANSLLKVLSRNSGGSIRTYRA